MTKEDIEQETNKFIEHCTKLNFQCELCTYQILCEKIRKIQDKQYEIEKDKKKKGE